MEHDETEPYRAAHAKGQTIAGNIRCRRRDPLLLLQWAERLLEGGGNEQWGENWEERFKDGSGSKKVPITLY